MKRYLLSIIVFAFIQTQLIAQPSKGNYLLGGSFILSTHNQNIKDYGVASNGEYNEYNLRVYPTIKYYTSDRFVVGLSFGYGHQNIKNIYNDIAKSSYESITDIYYVTPSLRLVMYSDENISLYNNLSVDLGWGDGVDNYFYGKTPYPYKNMSYNISSNSVFIGPGVGIHVSSKIIFEGSLGLLFYSKTSFEIKDSSISINPLIDESDYGIQINMSRINLGVFIVL